MALTAVRWGVRLVLLAAAVLLAMGGPVPEALARAAPESLPRVVPALSPLVALSSSLAQRQWYLAWFWLAPPLAVLAMGLWKGRLFCRWVCPAGTLYAIPAKLTLRKRLLKPRIGGYVFWIVVFSSLVGVPLLAALDPLSTFNRLTPLATGTYTLLSLVPGLLVPLMLLLLGVFQPRIWCTHICPLGYLFDLSYTLRRQGPVKAFSPARRSVLAGLVVGVPAAAVMRRFLLAPRNDDALPVLPPGADTVESFAATCTRCYACMNVCDSRVIRVGSPLNRSLGQLFQPEVEFFCGHEHPDQGSCPEWCNACSQVCPTGALKPLTLDEKGMRQIGVAKVLHDKCLAWEDGLICMVCQEVCPYWAIDYERRDGVPCPVVNESMCRGCGYCHSHCPATDPAKGITVVGVRRQKQLGDDAIVASRRRRRQTRPRRPVV